MHTTNRTHSQKVRAAQIRRQALRTPGLFELPEEVRTAERAEARYLQGAPRERADRA